MTLELTKQLIACASVTPADAGCQQLIAERLSTHGFKATHLRFDDVDNIWLTHGEGAPLLAFLGHTDVVPAGPLDAWLSDPFQPEERDGMLYGRGAADMKSGLAAMVTAMERFVTAKPHHAGTIAMLLTSDEEGIAINGTVKVVEYLQANKINIDWCLVGEPSSQKQLGDVVKNGRRGSLNCHLIVTGKQGHTAYPQLADNPVHKLTPALHELTQRLWDAGNEDYPPTSLQISNIQAGTGASNVIPGSIEVDFNMRFSTLWTAAQLKAEIHTTLEKYQLDYACHWAPSSQPFLTEKGRLLEAINASVNKICGMSPVASTAGGTSDGRFIAPTGAEIVELGPLNATIHKVNECVSIEDLNTLSKIYESVLNELMV